MSGVGGGDGGIRTLDTGLPYTHFPGVRLRPLGHVSALYVRTIASLHEDKSARSSRHALVVQAAKWQNDSMKSHILAVAALCALVSPSQAQEAEDKAPALSPNDIVSQAPPEHWVSIPGDDLLLMTLAPDSEGNPREVIIQLMPPPFSEGWVHNIKLLARSGWYDGVSVNRVQDNYVVQWGDPNHDNPESEGEKKTLPAELMVMGEKCYSNTFGSDECSPRISEELSPDRIAAEAIFAAEEAMAELENGKAKEKIYDTGINERDSYSKWIEFNDGWPLASGSVDESGAYRFWPVHCYGMVGVGRNYSPDTGSGAELYTVIGHAPRHLDRNIALVGRIIEGMEHLSSLPRGKGALGFYKDPAKRTPILSIRVVADLPEEERTQYEFLSTESESFARYAAARANRRDPFFIHPAGGADICNIPVPVRPSPNG